MTSVSDGHGLMFPGLDLVARKNDVQVSHQPRWVSQGQNLKPRAHGVVSHEHD